MTPREVYAVRWHQHTHCWYSPQTGDTARTKQALVRRMARHLARRWRLARVPCQLRIFGKHGRILSERTYGLDPRRYPG